MITERSHIGRVILVTHNDLVYRVDDDRGKMLILYPSDELRYKLIERYCVSAQIPDDDVLCVVGLPAKRGVYLEKTVDRTCGVDL